MDMLDNEDTCRQYGADSVTADQTCSYGEADGTTNFRAVVTKADTDDSANGYGAGAPAGCWVDTNLGHCVHWTGPGAAVAAADADRQKVCLKTNVADFRVDIPRETAFSPEFLAATTDVQVAEMENCLFKTKAWLEGLYGKYKKCKDQGTAEGTGRAKDDCTNQKVDCDTAQHDFEIARCWWAVDHDYHCTAYVGCVESELKDNSCNTLCRDVREITLRNKADYETGERIQCLLEALFGSINPDYDPSSYVATDNTTWALIPRTTDNNALLDGGEDETARWVKWCHSQDPTDPAERFTLTQVVKRFYDSNNANAPLTEFKTKHTVTLPDTTSTDVYTPTFDEILAYEKRYFDLRCTGDNNNNVDGTAHANSRMFGLRLPLTGSGDQTSTSVDLKAKQAAEDYALHPRSVDSGVRSTVSPLGYGYRDCTTGTWYDANNMAPTAVSYTVANGIYALALNNQASTSPQYQQNCNEMTPYLTAKYSLNLQTQWDTFNPTTYTETRTTEGHLWRPAHTAPLDSSTGFEGGVLYLTQLAKGTLNSAYAVSGGFGPSTLHRAAFDCTEHPVPGEKRTCSRSVLRRYPYRECWVDVYRSDSLRAEVPFCDISPKSGDSNEDIQALSHASFFGNGAGCATATPKSEETSCDADVLATGFNSDDDGKYFSESDFDHDESIIGKCCTQAKQDSLLNNNNWNSGLATAGAFDKTNGEYKEAYPSGSTRTFGSKTISEEYSKYKCAGQYMFTHAERESAFGSDKLIGHNYYGSTDTTAVDFNSGETNGYWYKNVDYGSELAGLSGAQTVANNVATTQEAGLDAKNEWSISSDIQGAYKVVASTDKLGTTCTLRSGETTIKTADASSGTGTTARSGNTYA